MTPAQRREYRRLRQMWRNGIPVPAPRKPVLTVEAVFEGQRETALERLATTGEMAAIARSAELGRLWSLLDEAEALARATRDGLEAAVAEVDSARKGLEARAGGAS